MNRTTNDRSVHVWIRRKERSHRIASVKIAFMRFYRRDIGRDKFLRIRSRIRLAGDLIKIERFYGRHIVGNL